MDDFHDFMMTSSEDGIYYGIFADYFGATPENPANPDVTIYVKCHGFDGVSALEVSGLVMRRLIDLEYRPTLTKGDAANRFQHQIHVPNVFGP